MAYIRKIRFDRTGRYDGCTCDRCGQYIRNIYTVEYTDGLVYHFGIDCFEKLSKESKLTDYGMKVLKKALKSLEQVQANYEAEKALTEETDECWQSAQGEWNKHGNWYGVPWQEKHDWMINVWYPARFADIQKEIDRFKKVNFVR